MSGFMSVRLRCLLLAGTAIIVGVPAAAQTSVSAGGTPSADQRVGDPATEQAATEQTGGLQDIVVTARRRVENVQNVPVAETVVSALQIQQLAITSVEKLSALAPQLIVGRNGSGNGASIGLRGITVNATSISLEQSVATVFDGVYISGGRALNLGLFDVAQIEVLKGPQSLFYGKNTTAGAISVTTADPTRTFEAMTKIGYEFNAQQPYVQGFVSSPVTDTLAVRLAGGYSHQFGSLIENVSNPGIYRTRDVVGGALTNFARPAGRSDIPGERNGFARLGIKWEAGDGLTAVVKATYNNYHTNTPNSSAVIAACESGRIQSDPTAPCGHRFQVTQAPLPPEVANTNPYLGRHNGQTYMDYYSINVTGNVTYDTDKFTLSFVPAYVRQSDFYVGDFDFTDNYQSNNANITGNREILEGTSAELRLQTHLGGMFNVMVGGFYQHAYTLFLGDAALPRSLAAGGGGPENSAAPLPQWRYLGLSRNGRTKGDTYSAFGQLLVDVTPTLNVTGGLRYTHETKNSLLRQPYVNPDFTGLYRIGEIGADQSFNNLSPEATVTWKPTRDVTVFGSYRTGYKSGGFSISGVIARTSTPADATFGNEKVAGFEGGIKSTLFDRQLRLNLTAYTYGYRGIQVDFIDPVTIQFFTQNAARSRTKGIELEGEYAPRTVNGLTLRGSVSYNDARYVSFPSAPCVGGQTPAEGCNVAPLNPTTGAFTRQNLSGQRLPQAPRWTGTAGVNYDLDAGADHHAFLATNLRYSSRYKIYGFAPDAADRFFQSSYAAIDGTIGFGRRDDRWLVQLVGKNLTNKFVVTTGYDLAGTGARAGLATGVHSDTRAAVAEPRTVALELIAKF